jgi:hypothetical protein
MRYLVRAKPRNRLVAKPEVGPRCRYATWKLGNLPALPESLDLGVLAGSRVTTSFGHQRASLGQSRCTSAAGLWLRAFQHLISVTSCGPSELAQALSQTQATLGARVFLTASHTPWAKNDFIRRVVETAAGRQSSVALFHWPFLVRTTGRGSAYGAATARPAGPSECRHGRSQLAVATGTPNEPDSRVGATASMSLASTSIATAMQKSRPAARAPTGAVAGRSACGTRIRAHRRTRLCRRPTARAPRLPRSGRPAAWASSAGCRRGARASPAECRLRRPAGG